MFGKNLTLISTPINHVARNKKKKQQLPNTLQSKVVLQA